MHMRLFVNELLRMPICYSYTLRRILFYIHTRRIFHNFYVVLQIQNLMLLFYDYYIKARGR